MAFTDHYQSKKMPEGSHAWKQGKQLVQKLLDSHLIGVQVCEDFVYDPKKGEGYSKQLKGHRDNFFSQILKSKDASRVDGVFSQGGEKDANVAQDSMASPGNAVVIKKTITSFEPNIAKIKNFAVAMPYGGAGGQKIFFHGKELFTPKQAREIFEKGKPIDEIEFSDSAVEKASIFFRNESFNARLMHYLLQGKPDMLGLLELSRASILEHYPKLILPPVPDNEEGLVPFVNGMVSALAAVGVDIEAEMQKAQKNLPSESKNKLLKKINEEVPAKLETYLAEHTDIATRFGDQLRAYHKTHHNDWEILENFKTGLTKADSARTSVEGILEAGIRERAQTMLREIAKTIANPYSRQMETIEKGMAETIVQSLQPKTIDVILRDKTATVFFDDENLKKAESVMGFSAGFALGKFAAGTPQSKHFSEFVLASNPELSKRELPFILRHEFEHKLDFKPDMDFAAKYKERIPAMIAADKDKLIKTIEFVDGLSDASPREDIERLRVLVKKRDKTVRIKDAATENPRPNAITINEAREWLLSDLYAINTRFNVLLPNKPKPNEPAGPSSNPYEHNYSKFWEVPTILEEVKGRYGRAFIGEIMPQLSRATSEHRKAVYQESRADSRSA